MARETKAQRIEREHAELTEQVAFLTERNAGLRREIARLEDRIGFLYAEAVALGTSLVQTRLGYGAISPERERVARLGTASAVNQESLGS